jgi:hypothetical protein
MRKQRAAENLLQILIQCLTLLSESFRTSTGAELLNIAQIQVPELPTFQLLEPYYDTIVLTHGIQRQHCRNHLLLFVPANEPIPQKDDGGLN